VTGNDRDGILIEDSSGNNVTGNDASSNVRNGILLDASDGNNLTGNNVSDSGAGLFLSSSDNNDLVNNEANSTDRNGIFLSFSDNNNLTGNDASANGRNGIFLSIRADNNNLTDNTANGNDDDGIRISDSQNNDVSESLAENNNVGIRFDETAFGFDSLADSGNTFTNDTSKNNTDWDFVIQTSGGSITPTSVNPADLPVTNLNIGASTNPDTTLSFDGKDVEVRSNSTPPGTPVGLDGVGRYFEAENITPRAFLNATVSYDDPDVPSNESDLGLYRYNATSGLWDLLPSEVDTTNNTVSAEILDFSTFGVLEQNRSVNFEVNITDTNSPVQEGDDLTVDANVTNTGNVTGTQIVQLDIDGTVLDSQSITLGSGESTPAVFVWKTRPGDAGEYIATVSSDDDNDTAPVEVLAGGECVNRRDLGRGQEDSECPFDRDISRGGSREELDRNTGRGGTGEHRDSSTSRRNRGRGSTRGGR
jgi:parallel beta-helix repeat protein